MEYVFYDKKTEKDVLVLLKESDLSEDTYKRVENICEKKQDKMKCCLVDKTMDIYAGVKSYVRGKGLSIITLTRDTLK